MKISLKFNFASCAFLLSMITMQSVAQVNKFVINGSLTNMAVMPSKIYLRYDPIMEKPTDSAVVYNGKYSFHGEVEAPVVGTIALTKMALKTATDQFNLMLDKGMLNIISDRLVGNSTVTGSGANAHTEYLKVTKYAFNESAALKRIMDSEAYKTDEAVKKEVTSRSNNLLGSALSNMILYVRQNPASPASPYFTYALISSGYVMPTMTDTLYRTFPARLKGSKLGLAIEATLAKRKAGELEAAARRKALDDITPLGSKALEFTQNDVNGKPVSLSSYKGKYVLIDFWASWCMPCRAENPNVVRAYNTYKNKNFTVLGVSLDGASLKDKWIAAIEKDGLTWTQVSDLKGGNNEVAKLYGVESIPQNFLVDPNGIIVAKNLRGDDLDKKLAELIK